MGLCIGGLFRYRPIYGVGYWILTSWAVVTRARTNKSSISTEYSGYPETCWLESVLLHDEGVAGNMEIYVLQARIRGMLSGSLPASAVSRQWAKTLFYHALKLNRHSEAQYLCILRWKPTPWTGCALLLRFPSQARQKAQSKKHVEVNPQVTTARLRAGSGPWTPTPWNNARELHDMQEILCSKRAGISGKPRLAPNNRICGAPLR